MFPSTGRMTLFPRLSSPDSDPFDLIRLMAGLLLGIGTIVALGLWLAGVNTEALLVMTALWSIYGLIHAVLDGVLEPLIATAAEVLQNVGLKAAGGGYSVIEALVARGEYNAAVADYDLRARKGDAEAQVRRALLLAGPLENGEQARTELEQFRSGRRLTPAEDIRVGLALAEIQERRLGAPGEAMRELRRLLDLYPTARGVRQIHRTLSALKSERFGSS